MEKEKIKCSVGIITYNSGKTIRRCLESIKDFDDIVICDGGSDDDTLDIARSYSCVIIEQTEKGAIKDYGREKNKAMDASRYDWYFSLDSDEYLPKETVGKIREICSKDDIEFYIYNVRRLLVSPDLKVLYKEYKNVYQTRFWNKKCNARFGRNVNEKIYFDKKKYKIGIMDEGWCVVFNTSFSVLRKKIKTRVGMQISVEKQNKGVYYLFKNIISPFIVNILKSIFRFFYVKIKYSQEESVPGKIELFRAYASCYTTKVRIIKFFKE